MNRSLKSKKHTPAKIDLHSAGSSALSVAAPPAMGAPRVPRGYVPATSNGKKGMRPARSQVIDAPGVAAEVKASATFAADFTAHAQPTALAQTLERAHAWRTELAAAEAWHKYVREQAAEVWRVLLADLEALKLAFAFARKKDPTMIARYPQLARMLGVRHEAGVRGARTRALDRAKKKPATAAAASPTATGVGQPTTNGAGNAVVTNGTSATTAHA